MQITKIIISREVLNKIRSKHNVTRMEVEEVFLNQESKPRVYRSERIKGAYVAYGQTFDGRYLMVAFFHIRKDTAKIITARDMNHAERRRYERK